MRDPLKTICSRAWTDLNIDFYLNRWRYCCKAVWVPIPEKYDHTYFIDNPYIKKTREELATGIETSACNWCWNDYKKTGHAWRDVANVWPNGIENENITPSLVLTFDNICDQSCLYCGPENSSKWAKELNNSEHVDTSPNTKKQIDALVKWLATVETSEQIVFQVLGGEPTYSHNFYYFLEQLKLGNILENSNIIISVTTNGNTVKNPMEKLLKIMNSSSWKWHIGLSNEACGEIGENIRYGLNMKRFENNLKLYLNTSNVTRLVFSPTMNAFSVKNFNEYIKLIHSIILSTNKEKEFTWVGNWVNDSPKELDCKYLPKYFSSYIDKAIETMENTSKDLNMDDNSDVYSWLNNMKNRIQNHDENLNIITNYLNRLSHIKPLLNKQILLDQLHD